MRIFIFALLLSAQSHAGLVTLGNATVLVNTLDLVFTQNANLSPLPVQYDPSLEIIEQLNTDGFANITSWRLPSGSELVRMHDLYLPELNAFFIGDFDRYFFTNLPPFGSGGRLIQGINVQTRAASNITRATYTGYAWAVSEATGLEVPVPETSSVIMFLIGLATLILNKRILT